MRVKTTLAILACCFSCGSSYQDERKNSKLYSLKVGNIKSTLKYNGYIVFGFNIMERKSLKASMLILYIALRTAPLCLQL